MSALSGSNASLQERARPKGCAMSGLKDVRLNTLPARRLALHPRPNVAVGAIITSLRRRSCSTAGMGTVAGCPVMDVEGKLAAVE